MENVKQFYKELGRLLYAVAMADRKVKRAELDALHKFVAKDLAFFERSSDGSGMNKAFYVDFEFETCMKEEMSVREAAGSFIEYLNANYSGIDQNLLEKAIKAIDLIAGSFRKINKEEQKVITTIKDDIAFIAGKL